MLISPGDFIDMYYRIGSRGGPLGLAMRFLLPAKQRTRSWWGKAQHVPSNFWDVPDVVARWNRLVTGDPEVPYIVDVRERCFSSSAGVKVLSPGCGEGEKECAIAQRFPDWEITGIDVSPDRIAAANAKVKQRGLMNVTFRAVDIDTFAFDKAAYDAVLFDSSLHHFRNFDRLFDKLEGALTADGVVIVNEYVGPDRFNWSRRQLAEANALLRSLPDGVRIRYGISTVKRYIFRPGYLRMLFSDPSEAVQSSRIVAALHCRFDIIREVPLGGNLLQLVLKDIAHNFAEPDILRRQALDRLYAAEERLLETEKSDFIYGIYRKRCSAV